MKKISTMTWVKLLLSTIVIGIMVFLVCKWNVSLDPPRKIAPAKTQFVVEVVMPSYAEQADISLAERDPEAYANIFFRNKLYQRSHFFSDVEDEVNPVNPGDTVQLKYSEQYFPLQRKWELLSIKPPFYESVEDGKDSHIEYLKGVVRAVVK